MSHPSRRLPRGTIVGPYEIDAQIGHGGMGAVYRARHTESGAVHALKVVLPAYLGRDSERAMARYRRESQVLARIDQHPGLVRVHAVGKDGDLPWCAMELVEGDTLSTVLGKGIPSHEQSAQLLAEIARAVEHAHHHGVIHRDLKPGNIIIDAQGSPRVVDFGLAYDDQDERLTNTGEFMGTPCFMAPEQVARSSDDGSGPDIGPAADVYGMGALLYNCLTGSPPFSDRSGIAVLVAITRESPRPPRHLNASVPPALEAICLRALQNNPALRQPSAAALAEELEKWLRGESVPSGASSRLRAQAAQYLPTSNKRPLLVAGLALILVGSLLATTRPPPMEYRLGAQDLSDMESVLVIGRRLSEAQRQTLQDLSETLPHGQVDRVRALQLLAKLLDLPPTNVSNEPLTALAIHIRQTTSVDQRRLIQIMLHSHQRLAQLHALLHGSEPVLAARKEVAAKLARFLASGDSAPPPPVDSTAFSVLRDAAGLSDEVRGQLLMRHAGARLKATAPNLSGVLEELLQAQQESGVTLPAADWPPELLVQARDEFLATIDEEDLDVPRALDLDNLLARADGGNLELSAIEVNDRQVKITTAVAMGTDNATAGLDPTLTTRRLVLWLSFVERQGLSPLSMSKTESACNQVGVEQVIKLGNSEAKRPSTICNPSLLMTLTLLLCGRKNKELGRVPPEHWEIANRWVETARSAGVSAPWLHLSIAGHLYNQGHRAEAMEAMEQALRLDRQRPCERRITEIPQLMGTFLLGYDRRAASLEDLRRVAALAMEAASIQDAHKPLIASFKKLNAITPRMLDKEREVRSILRMAAGQLTERGVKACCHGKPSVDELLQRRQGLVKGSRRSFEAARITMRHHELHGRWAEALTSARQALDLLNLAISPDRLATDGFRRRQIRDLKRSIEQLEVNAAGD